MLLSSRGHVFLSDFGLARFTRSLSTTQKSLIGTIQQYGTGAAKNEGYVALEFLNILALGQRSTQNLDQLAVYHIAASQLPPKATSSFEFTLTKPAAQGQLEFASHLPEQAQVRNRLPSRSTSMRERRPHSQGMKHGNDTEGMLWCDEALKEQAGMRCRITTACSSQKRFRCPAQVRRPLLQRFAEALLHRGR